MRRSVLFGLAAALLSVAAASAETLRDVTIRAHVPADSPAVYLAGNAPELGPWKADGMKMDGTGAERTAHVKLPDGFAFEYKVTLGEWSREGLGPSGTVMPNATLTVSGDSQGEISVVDWKKDPRAYIADWKGSGVEGRLDYWLDVKSTYLATPRHVEIWLPPDYAAHPKRRFPVIYMHDGQNLFDPRIANTGMDWGVDEAIVDLVKQHKIEPAIVVGIWCTDKRRFEYTPQKVLDAISDDFKPSIRDEFPDGFLGDAYLKFIVEELKPRIDAAYRTRPGRASTFTMGSSMGALISFYALTEYPDVFGGAAGLSMHWPVGIHEKNIFTNADTWRPQIMAAYGRYLGAKKLDPKTHRVWFDHGTVTLDQLYGPYQDAARPMLAAQGWVEGKTLMLKTYEGAAHNERAWRARLRDPLTFLLSAKKTP